MTSIVGVLCQDGAVLGTDSSVTFSDGRIRTIEQSAEKLHVIENRVLLAGTGAVGHGQRFEAIIREGVETKRFDAKRSPLDVCKELSGKTIADFQQTNSPKGLYGALVAFPLGQRTVLCEFDVQHFQPQLLTEQIWYCSMGSAQGITDPFLALMREIFWTTGLPSVSDATFAVVWALDHAISVNPGGVDGPPQIAVLERGTKGRLSPKVLDDNHLEEHRASIEAAKNRLRQLPAEIQGVAKHGVEEVPTGTA